MAVPAMEQMKNVMMKLLCYSSVKTLELETAVKPSL